MSDTREENLLEQFDNLGEIETKPTQNKKVNLNKFIEEGVGAFKPSQTGNTSKKELSSDIRSEEIDNFLR